MARHLPAKNRDANGTTSDAKVERFDEKQNDDGLDKRRYKVYPRADSRSWFRYETAAPNKTLVIEHRE